MQHTALVAGPWSSLVEGGEGLYLPNCQTNLVIALDALSLLFCIFINTTAYHLPWLVSAELLYCERAFTYVVIQFAEQLLLTPEPEVCGANTCYIQYQIFKEDKFT